MLATIANASYCCWGQYSVLGACSRTQAFLHIFPQTGNYQDCLPHMKHQQCCIIGHQNFYTEINKTDIMDPKNMYKLLFHSNDNNFFKQRETFMLHVFAAMVYYVHIIMLSVWPLTPQYS